MNVFTLCIYQTQSLDTARKFKRYYTYFLGTGHHFIYSKDILTLLLYIINIATYSITIQCNIRIYLRELEYPKFSLDESIDSIPFEDEKTDDEPKQNVEYLPFWKHMPPKKGNVLKI